jgi:hypothetical protein
VTISEWKDLVTMLGVLVAAVSLGYAPRNTSLTVRTNRARFWLDLRDRFSKHDDVHRRLRPGGAWASGKGPESLVDLLATVAGLVAAPGPLAGEPASPAVKVKCFLNATRVLNEDHGPTDAVRTPLRLRRNH